MKAFGEQFFDSEIVWTEKVHLFKVDMESFFFFSFLLISYDLIMIKIDFLVKPSLPLFLIWESLRVMNF